MSQRGGGVLGIDQTENITWLDGKLEYRKHSNNSELAEAVGYFTNGKLQFNFPMRQGRLHGVCRIWRESGMLESEEEYIRGVFDGFVRRWYLSGRMEFQLRYSRGVRHGPSKYWNEQGELVSAKVYLSGREVPEEIAQLILDEKLSASHILGIKNAPFRQFCLEEFGYERFLSQMKYEVIEKESEQELVRINWVKSEEPIYLVKVKCPSTGAYYTLRVPPTSKTIKEAIAWTFGMNQMEYLPQQEA
jgi:hypothetical protein